MIITTKMLREAKACTSQVDLFIMLFGDGGTVTLKRCLRAADKGLQFSWALRLLSNRQSQFYYDNIGKVSDLIDQFLPYWWYYGEPMAKKVTMAMEVTEDEYHSARYKARRRAFARLFFAATEVKQTAPYRVPLVDCQFKE